MKSLITILSFCYVCATAVSPVHAQATAGKLADANGLTTEFPPLLSLIDSAIKHNAMIRFRQQDIAAKACNVTTQKNFWTRNFGVQADTRYGTFDNFLSSANSGGTTLQSITTRQFNYGAGLYIKLPVFDVINRKNQINQAKAELAQAENMAKATEDDIRQTVIRQYSDLLLKQKLAQIKSQSLGSATVNMDMIEKEFRNGLIPIAEYVRISDMTSRAQAEYETAKSDFILAKKLLEDFTGFSFDKQ